MNGVLPETEDYGDLCLHRVEASASLCLKLFSKANKQESSAFKTCICLSLDACVLVCPCTSESPFACFCTYIGFCVFFPTRLEQQVQDKEMLERELYSRFVMVLNEKKAKIRGLQDAVRQLHQTDDQQRDKEGRQRSADLFCLASPNSVMLWLKWLALLL